MLQKFLLIGVGGSGGKTLRYTWRELDRRLRASGWTEGVPEGWQFLHIDVPEQPDVVEDDVPVKMGGSARYLGLAKRPRTYRDFDAELVGRPELLPAIAGWRPDPTRDYSSPYKGAGQRRVVGRVVGLTELDAIGDALNASVGAMSSARVDEQMKRLNRHCEADVTVNSSPTAVVISSLGGGSGSGIFLDVIELLMARRTEQTQWLSDSLITVLYAADVFGHLSSESKPGIEPNSLAAVSELLSAYEHEGEINELEDKLLERGGGTHRVSGRRTGRTNFIIGIRNEAMKFSTSSDVFRSVGKTFAAFMGNQDVQREFATYIDTNPSARTITEAFAVTDQTATNRPCSSFGYANVSLGRSLFSQYAAERIAKRALDRLLRGHHEHKKSDYAREDVLIDERAQSVKETFFAECRLWESTTVNNQVLDAFRSVEDVKNDLQHVVATVKDDLRARVETKLSAAEWFKSLGNAFHGPGAQYDAKQRERRNVRASEWVSPIQNQVLLEAAEYSGRYGIPVTLRLLDLLGEQVRTASEELEREASELINDERQLLNRTQQLFETIREKTVTPKHPNFPKAVDNRLNALRCRSEAELKTFAAKVMRDLERNFLPTIREALRGGMQTLLKSEENEHRRLVEQWSAGSVPSHLKAAPNELLLEKEGQFPDQLEELIEELTSIDSVEDAFSVVLEEVVSGAWPRLEDDPGSMRAQDVLQLASRWAPEDGEARAPGTSAQQAKVRMEMDAADLLERAETWVRQRQGPIQQFVTQDLGKWLDSSHPDAAVRADRFVQAFEQAMQSARPLISINPTTFQTVHGSTPEAPRILLSPLPFDRSHRAAERVRAALEAAGIPTAEAESKFRVNAKVTEVEVSSFLARSVHPIVFDSVFNPVLRDWQTRTSAADRQQFWEFRRARTLTSYTPLSPRRQEALVRGFHVAWVLKQIPNLNRKWSESPFEVWTPKGPRRLPLHLLGGDVSSQLMLPGRLLESFPLAFLSFNAGQPEEMEAYLRLMELGSLTLTDFGSVTPAADLSGWIRDGTQPQDLDGRPAPIPSEKAIGSATDSAEERRDALVEWLRNYDRKYSEYFGGLAVRPDTTHQLGPEWEVRDLVSRAVNTLIEALGSMQTKPETGDVFSVEV